MARKKVNIKRVDGVTQAYHVGKGVDGVQDMSDIPKLNSNASENEDYNLDSQYKELADNFMRMKAEKEAETYVEENTNFMNLENKSLHYNGRTMSVGEYITCEAGGVLDSQVEHLFMNGGCAVYALALKELHPEYELAVEKVVDNNIITYEHVFCVNRETGEAYDVRGRFDSAEALYDYDKDVEVKFMTDPNASHIIVDEYELEDLISDGFFKYEPDTDNGHSSDMSITKGFITNFKTRFV